MAGEANIFPAIISFAPSRHRSRDHNDKHGDMCQYGVRKSHYAIIKGRVNLFKDNLNMTSDFIHWFVDMFLFGLGYFHFFFFSPPFHSPREKIIYTRHPYGVFGAKRTYQPRSLSLSWLNRYYWRRRPRPSQMIVTMNARRNICINTCIWYLYGIRSL